MTEELKIHPAANLFPEMSANEYVKLKEDIRVNGLLSPIVFWRGQLIDGRHRIRACNELGVFWKNMTEEAEADKDPVKVALSLNMHRRHLNTSQLAMVADKARGIYDKEGQEAKSEGQKSGGRGRKKNSVVNLPQSIEPMPQGGIESRKSRDKAAKAVGVSGSLADAAKKVRTKGTTELQQAVESGEVAVSAAAIVATKPPEEQQRIVASGEVAKVAAEERKAKKAASASLDDAAVAAMKACENPLVVLTKIIPSWSPEQITTLYLYCESLLPQ